MIKYIELTNYKNDTLKIDIFNPKTSGFDIRKIDGLGPVKADITTTKLVTSDGDYYNNARANGRNIVLTLGLNIVPELGINSIEDCRQLLYKYCPLKKKLKFNIITDNREIYTYGYVESNQPDIFSEDETVQISLICPNSWFNSGSDQTSKISNVKALFKFPFEVLEVDESAKDLTDRTKPYGLVKIFEEDATQTDLNFFGNDVFNLYDNLVTYGELDFLTYENFRNLTYDEIRRLKHTTSVINI